MNAPARLGLALAMGLLAAPPLAGQTPTFIGGVQAVAPRARSDASGGTTRLGGTGVGWIGILRVWRVELEARYAQGGLEPEEDAVPRRDLVQGQVTLGVRALPWLTVGTGAQVRTYELDSGPERWVVALIGARAEVPIIGPTVRGHVALWRALSVSANVSPGSGHGQSGEVGMTVQLPRGPFWLGLAYGIDRAELQGGSRRETVDGLTLTLGVGRL